MFTRKCSFQGEITIYEVLNPKNDVPKPNIIDFWKASVNALDAIIASNHKLYYIDYNDILRNEAFAKNTTFEVQNHQKNDVPKPNIPGSIDFWQASVNQHLMTTLT